MALPLVTADGTRIYNEDLVATAERVNPTIVENAINSHPGASIFLGNVGAILTGEIRSNGAPTGGAEASGGESVRTNVKLGTNGSARRLASGFGEFSTDTSDTARGSRSNWKLYGSTVIMSGSQVRKNSGAEQVINQLNYKQTDSVSALVDLVAEDLLTTSSQPNAISSLPTLIHAADTFQTLSGSTFQNWNSRGLQDKGTAAASISFTPGTTSFAAAGLSNWRTAYMNAEEGSIKPDAIITTDAIFRYYEGSLTPQVRFQDPRIGDLSFEALRFKQASVFHDPYCASGMTLFVNTNMTKIKYLPGALFDITPRHDQDSQDAFSMKVIFEAQLCTMGRKFNNKVIGQTA